MVEFADIDKKKGFPVGTLKSVCCQESSDGVNLISPKGAKGIFGFMPDARNEVLQETGKDAWSTDRREAAEAAGYYLSKMLKRFDGDFNKALAAYNAGAGTVRRAERSDEDSWLRFMPAETRNYVVAVQRRVKQFGHDVGETVSHHLAQAEKMLMHRDPHPTQVAAVVAKPAKAATVVAKEKTNQSAFDYIAEALDKVFGAEKETVVAKVEPKKTEVTNTESHWLEALLGLITTPAVTPAVKVAQESNANSANVSSLKDVFNAIAESITHFGDSKTEKPSTQAAATKLAQAGVVQQTGLCATTDIACASGGFKAGLQKGTPLHKA